MYDISVIFACSKFDEYTFPALDSVLSSTGVNLQLVIVANGRDFEMLYARFNAEYGHFENVKILKSPIGQLSFALNFGVSFSDSEYIGRMDADDICKPERFERQLDYLKENNLDVLGSDIFLIDSSGNLVGERSYPRKKDINRRVLAGSPFCHPSVIFKKSVLVECRGYNSGFNSEDYDLWLRLSRNDISWDNIDDKLLFYRVHSNSTQGSKLAYAEVCSHFFREFLLEKGIRRAKLFFGFFYSFMKFFYVSTFK